MKWPCAASAAVALLLLTGCGGSGETTTVERVTTVEAPAHEASPGYQPSRAAKAPNVIGLPLDVAEELLEEAGYRAAATNTDTTFGIMVPSHYTVCTQGNPRGSLVPMLAQKYGC
jgi:hypothetical protein